MSGYDHSFFQETARPSAAALDLHEEQQATEQGGSWIYCHNCKDSVQWDSILLFKNMEQYNRFRKNNACPICNKMFDDWTLGARK